MTAPKLAFNETTTGLPLWEQVKLALFFNSLNANEKLETIFKIKMPDERLNEDHLGKAAEEFKASVLKFYISMRMKVDYHKNRPSVSALIDLDMDQFIMNPAALDLKTAITAFLYLNDLLEYDGVTYFENKKLDPEDSFIGELE